MLHHLFVTTAMAAGIAAGLPAPAHATTVIIGDAAFCGPSSGMGCEDGTEHMIWLQAQKDVTLGFGNVGAPHSLPIVDIKSDSGPLNMFFNLANGFATITPTHPAVDFNGVDIRVPGFEITRLVFDEQLTPVGRQTSVPFSITADDIKGKIVTALLDNTTNAPNSDDEWSVAALNGTGFRDVNIVAPGGFDEIKHLEIDVIPSSIPESSTWAMLLLGFGFLAFAGHRARARLAVY